MKHEIKIKPFGVPNFAIGLEKPGLSFPIHELSDEALDQLCEQFRKDLKEKVRQARSTPRE